MISVNIETASSHSRYLTLLLCCVCFNGNVLVFFVLRYFEINIKYVNERPLAVQFAKLFCYSWYVRCSRYFSVLCNFVVEIDVVTQCHNNETR